MNYKTMAMVAVILSVVTAVYLVGIDNGSDGDSTVTINGRPYFVISDADTAVYTDSTVPGARIYVDSATVRDSAFKDCTKIQYVVFSDRVTSIGDRAFEGCTKLGYIEMTKVRSIGDYAFKDTVISACNISPDLESIGRYAFENCTCRQCPILTGTNVTELKEGVFKNSDAKIEDLRNITKIAETAFEGTELKGQIVNENQRIKLSRVPEVVIANFNYQKIDLLISDKLYIQVVVDRDMVLTGTDSTGISEYTPTIYSYYPEQYACDIAFNNASLRIDARSTTIHFESFLGMQDIVRKSGDGTLTMPAPEKARSMFRSWSLEGIEGNVVSITEGQFKALGTDIYPIAQFGTRTITYDHSQLPSSYGLPTSRTFTVGDRYEALDDVDGYEFFGWRVNGELYPVGAYIDTYADHTAYSVWNAMVCNVEIMGANGIVAGTLQVEAGSRLDLSKIAVDVPQGMSLAGWSLSRNGDVLTQDPRVDSDMRLYAVFSSKQQYTVMFVDRGTTLGSMRCYDGDIATIRIDNPSREGMTFQNWLGDDGTKYYRGDAVRVLSNMALTAVWETDTVSVYYHLNEIEKCTYDWGSEVTLGTESAFKEGYELLGWSLRYRGPVDYQDGETVVLTETLELYPCWMEAGKLKVSCHDYTGRTSVKEFSEGEVFTVPRSSFREGATFLGWSFSPSGNIEYYPGDYFAVYSDMDLYEIWETVKKNIVRCHDYTGAIRSAEVANGSLYTVPKPSARDGGTFLGWSLDSSGTVQYTPGDSFTVTGDTDLYEVWRMSTTFTVTCHSDDGRVRAADVASGGTFTVPKAISSKEGRFSGWSLSPKGYAEYTPGDSFTVNKDIDLYEVWDLSSKYTVTCHDYAGGEKSSVVEAGGTFTVPRSSVRENATFLGWSSSPGGTIQFSPGDYFTVTEDRDLYEIWDATTSFMVTCHAYDGRTSVTTVEPGKSFTVPKSSGRESGTFLGWSLSPTGNAQYSPGDSFLVTADTDLYETWKSIVRYTVVCHDRNGDTTMTEINEGATFTVPKPSSNDLAAFIGWSTAPEGAVIYTPGDPVTVWKDIDIFEVWRTASTFIVVCHDYQGGTATTEVEEGRTFTVPRSSDRDQGYFLGWSTGASGEICYHPGDFFTVTMDVDLYEIWDTTVEYIVVCHDALGGQTSSTVATGQTFIAPTADDREGYIFLGWGASPGGPAAYLAGAPITITRDLDLYQVWKEKGVFTVTVHADDDLTYTGYEGATIQVQLPAMAREGYALKGWTTFYGSLIVQYPAPGDAEATSDVDFYPVWEEIETITVLIHMAGTEILSETLYAGEPLELPESLGKKDGKTHLGWTVNSDGTGRFFSVDSTIYPAESLELFVFWSEPDIEELQ
jgi:hypothetical protein